MGRESFLEHDDNDQKEEDNTLFYLTMDSKLNYKLTKQYFTETHFAWAHLSCASFIEEINYTCRSAVKLNKVKENQFNNICLICKQKHGICVKCSNKECEVFVHAECAR